MNIKTDPKSLSFSELKQLRIFEEELFSKIKGLLNESFPSIRVIATVSLEKANGRPICVTTSVDGIVEGEQQLVEQINQYISTRDDIESILREEYTLRIDLSISKRKDKAMSPDNNESRKTGQENSLPEFIPQSPRYCFDQIILPDHIKKEIFDAVKIIQCKDIIYKEWGFEEVDPVPRSVLNFYGEPGTGKTMCAHAIAQYLGKKILALNYSEIESKYVGEAPKNLQRAFDIANQTDSVLFFDEADSFLGKRIENVTQGADQALNSLRSQMLILLEEFSGVVVFATNLVTNFDHAFESRILKHIKFELPNREARAAIIKKMLPKKLPIDSVITDVQFLEASDLIDGLSGREIKSAVLEMIIQKADHNTPDVSFSFEDLKNSLSHKKQVLTALKEEEDLRLKKKIEKKLKEKAEEARALKAQEQRDVDSVSVAEESPG